VAFFKIAKPIVAVLEDFAIYGWELSAQLNPERITLPTEDQLILGTRVLHARTGLNKSIRTEHIYAVINVYLRLNIMGAWARQLESMIGMTAFDAAYVDVLSNQLGSIRLSGKDAESAATYIELYLAYRQSVNEGLRKAIISGAPEIAAHRQDILVMRALRDAHFGGGSPEQIELWLLAINNLAGALVVSYYKKYKLKT